MVQCLSLVASCSMTRERTTVLMRVCGEARQNGRIDGWQWDQTEVGEDLAVVPMAGTPRAIVKKLDVETVWVT
jgi:hypothetical protein